jgi:hypothetical protein
MSRKWQLAAKRLAALSKLMILKDGERVAYAITEW